jgi:hypothetical protein
MVRGWVLSAADPNGSVVACRQEREKRQQLSQRFLSLFTSAYGRRRVTGRPPLVLRHNQDSPGDSSDSATSLTDGVREEKIDLLRNSIATTTYQVSAGDLAQKIIDHMLQFCM